MLRERRSHTKTFKHLVVVECAQSPMLWRRLSTSGPALPVVSCVCIGQPEADGGHHECKCLVSGNAIWWSYVIQLRITVEKSSLLFRRRLSHSTPHSSLKQSNVKPGWLEK
jgi:hypothetical protein